MIGRSGDTVCDPHRTRGGDEKRRFSGLASKPVVTVSYFRPQIQSRWFSDLGLKITATVCRFAPQN
jgi:hypothetical protein